MTTKLRELLIRHEGKSAFVYRCPAGHKTIGIGHNIDAKGLPKEIALHLNEHGSITEQMINSLFAVDVMDAMKGCMELYPAFNMFSENRKCALVNFLFNVGKGTAETFVKAKIAINAGQWNQAAYELKSSKWYKQVGTRGPEIVKMVREG